MHQFLCLSERGGNFLKFALERGVPKKEGGGGVPTLEETMLSKT